MVEGVDLKQVLSGTLRIGYYAPIAPAFLSDVILSCVPNPMDVVLHLQNCDNDSAQEGLLNGTYDAIFFITEGVLPSVEFVVLVKAPAYCLLPIFC